MAILFGTLFERKYTKSSQDILLISIARLAEKSPLLQCLLKYALSQAEHTQAYNTHGNCMQCLNAHIYEPHCACIIQQANNNEIMIQ